MTLSEIKKRVYRVNNQLVKLGFTWPEIKAFWQECIDEAKLIEDAGKPSGSDPDITPGPQILFGYVRFAINALNTMSRSSLSSGAPGNQQNIPDNIFIRSANMPPAMYLMASATWNGPYKKLGERE